MEKKQFVYGIYSGCKFEGGNVRAPLYKDIADAKKVARLVVEKKQKDIEHIYADDPDGLKEMSFKQVNELTWENSIDEVLIQEYEII